MTNDTTQSTSASMIPADDPARKLSLIDPDDPQLRHVAVVGDTYTVLLSGAQTAGKYCLIDMNVPHCGGPGPHRHDFEEMFHILEGQIQFTFRSEKRLVQAGMTINIPANAPHFFTNIAGQRARKSSSWRSAPRSKAATRPHRSKAEKNRRRSWRRPQLSHQDTGQSSSNLEHDGAVAAMQRLSTRRSSLL